jgi:hypothetical protein
VQLRELKGCKKEGAAALQHSPGWVQIEKGTYVSETKLTLKNVSSMVFATYCFTRNFH